MVFRDVCRQFSEVLGPLRSFHPHDLTSSAQIGEAPTSSGDRALIAFVTVTEVRDRANAPLRDFT